MAQSRLEAGRRKPVRVVGAMEGEKKTMGITHRSGRLATLAVCSAALALVVSGVACAAPVTLRVLSTTIVEKPEGTIEQKIADEFMKLHPDIRIEFMGTPMNAAFQRITTLAVGGQMPDIFTNTPEFIAQADELGIAEDLRNLVDEAYLRGYDPNVLKEATYRGKVLFLPWFTIPQGVLYRSDWLKETGLKPPATWEEFTKVAEAMTKDLNGDGKPDRWGFAMLGSRNQSAGARFIYVLLTYGVDVLAKDSKGNWYTDLDSPRAVEALTMLANLHARGYVPPGVLETSYAEAYTQMALEKAGMMITGPHTVGAILAMNPALKGKLGSAPLPAAYRRATVLGTYGFSVYSGSPYKKEAVEYLKFLFARQNLLEFSRVTGRIPARVEATQAEEFDRAVFGAFVESAQYAVAIPQVPIYGEVQVLAADALQRVISGAASPEQALKAAAAQVRALIARM